MTALKERRRVVDKLGREWHVLAEFGRFYWLAPKPPDDEPPWTVHKTAVKELK